MGGQVTASSAAAHNVVGLFLEAAAAHPGVAALVAPTGDRVSFGALRERVEGCAAGLARSGIAPGDRVIFMLPMSIDLYVAVLGALAAGGVAVFVDPWVPLREIARLAGAAGAAGFVGTPASHLLRLLSTGLRRIPVTVTTKGALSALVARHRLDGFRGRANLAAVDPDGSALITFTTGSSGAPKGVNRTHAILAAQHAVIRQEFPAAPGDVDMTTFPVFALSNLAAGITTVIPPVNLRRVAAADGGRVARAMEAHGVTTAAASPPFFDAVAAHCRTAGARPPALRRIVTGGAPVRDDQLREWRALWPTAGIIVAFGSSEAEPVASIAADERLTLPPGRGGFCVGRPVPPVRTLLAPITRGPMARLPAEPASDIGELLVTGAHVCRDYVGNAGDFAENKVRDDDGRTWHRMGDTGYFDEAGRFWLVGRVHSTIRRAGLDVHPQLVEQAARGGDARIRHVAAVGVPDGTTGERVVLVVESDENVEADVRARLRAARVAEPLDALVVTRTPIPLDPRHNSKVDYHRLRQLLGAGAIR